MQARNLTAMLLLGLVVAFVATVGPAEESSSPEQAKTGFWIEDTTVDVGSVLAGQDVIGTFVFHNDSEEEVQILSAKPS